MTDKAPPPPPPPPPPGTGKDKKAEFDRGRLPKFDKPDHPLIRDDKT